MSKRWDSSHSRMIAAGGILAAGSLVLLWLACMVPSGRVGLAAVAGLFPVAGVLAAGRAAGYLCWAAAGVLGLFLLPDKGIALLYVLFLGVYPVAKGQIEALRNKKLEWCLKLLLFNVVLTLVWFVFGELFLPMLSHLPEMGGAVLYLAGNVLFIAYDIGLSRLISLLYHRIGPGRRW